MDNIKTAIRYKNEPFMATIGNPDNKPVKCTPVVWDGEECGVGILLGEEEDCGRTYGLTVPRNFIASWRGTEILRHLKSIELGTLAAAYHAGQRDHNDQEMEKFVSPLVAEIGQDVYDQIMSKPIPEKIIRAMLDRRNFDLRQDFWPDLWPIFDEVRAGTIIWRQEFADIGITHPNEVDIKPRQNREIITQFERLLSSFAKSQGVSRNCNGISYIERALLLLVKDGTEKIHSDEVIVAAAGAIGSLLTCAFTETLEIILRSNSPQQLKSQAIDKSARWLTSVCGRRWYHLWKRPNTFTASQAKELLREIVEQYFPSLPEKEREEWENRKEFEVTFQPKSSWQKDDCLYCSKPAVLEAVISKGNFSAHIRCCEESACQEYAAQLARQSAQGPLTAM